jgi:hypothetical protein
MIFVHLKRWYKKEKMGTGSFFSHVSATKRFLARDRKD